jgi:hypothetical protein
MQKKTMQVAPIAATPRPTRSTATNATTGSQRSTGSQSDSLRIQYQQGDRTDIQLLLDHRQGHLLRRLGTFLNSCLNKWTGFKVVPTYPLDKRIFRFVVGNGLQI